MSNPLKNYVYSSCSKLLTINCKFFLRDVHNFAVHFSTENITNELKNKL